MCLDSETRIRFSRLINDLSWEGGQRVLQVLDVFFFVFHSFWILLVLFGWMFKGTLRINLYAVMLTAVSWLGLGYWYGWGYCFCTDWHWQVRYELGFSDQTNSYVHLLVTKSTGMDIPADTVDYIVVFAFIISVAISVSLNLRDWRT